VERSTSALDLVGVWMEGVIIRKKIGCTKIGVTFQEKGEKIGGGRRSKQNVAVKIRPI